MSQVFHAPSIFSMRQRSPRQVFALSGLCRIESLTYRVSMRGFDDAFLTRAPLGSLHAAAHTIS
jgi:hypothetical protein